MTKSEQTRLWGWRVRVLREAASSPRNEDPSWTLGFVLRCGASYRARQDVQSSRGGPLVDRQRRQQQHRRAFGRHEQPVAAAFVVDGVRVVLVAHIDPNR